MNFRRISLSTRGYEEEEEDDDDAVAEKSEIPRRPRRPFEIPRPRRRIAAAAAAVDGAPRTVAAARLANRRDAVDAALLRAGSASLIVCGGARDATAVAPTEKAHKAQRDDRHGRPLTKPSK